MRIGLLTEGGYPYVSGDARLWCDRLVRGLGQYEFDVYALSRSERQENEGWIPMPPQVNRVRTAPLWTAEDDGIVHGRRTRRRFAEAYGELAAAICAPTPPGAMGAMGAADPRGPQRADDWEAVDVSEASEVSGALEMSGVPEVSEVLEASDTPDTPDTSEASEASGTSAFLEALAASDGVMGSETARHPRAAAARHSETTGHPDVVAFPEASAGTFDSEADRFAAPLYALADIARDEGGLVGALRSEAVVRTLERACRAPGALRAAREARVPDLLTVAAHLECVLRPLSLDWYEDDRLGSVDLCHAAAGGTAALPGLLARHFSGVPLLVTEYGVPLRAHYLTAAGSVPVRALLASFHGRLAAEVYRQAACVTPGNAHARRWQERCGADRAKIRTVHPGMEASRFTAVGEARESADPYTLVWVGRIEPAKDLITLLHAFAEVRRSEPRARLRIVGAPADGPDGAVCLAQCEALAARLFREEEVTEGATAVGDSPVSFEEVGGREVPGLADAYAAGSVVVLSSVVEGFPVSLVEAMFCGRATVSTDVGAVVEVIGGTGLVVPPREPRALAEACVALLRDPGRRARLGAAARARALELFTVEQNIAAFRDIYLGIVSRFPVRRLVVDEAGEPLPFGVPAEVHVPWRWTRQSRSALRVGPRWAVGVPVRATVSADAWTTLSPEAAASGREATPVATATATSSPEATAAPAPTPVSAAAPAPLPTSASTSTPAWTGKAGR